jgi:signal transduction histidine kinase
MMRSIRAGRGLGVAVFVTACVVILNLALWLQYRATRNDLEAELALRLENVARVVGLGLDAERLADAWLVNTASSLELPDSLIVAAEALRSDLVAIVEATNLANMTLYDSDGRPFMDVVSTGRGEPFADPLYAAEVLAALTGAAAHTPLYRSGTEYLMSGYAPVRGDATFAVGVEADARFFSGLRRLRDSLLLIGAASVASLAALGVFFARMQARLTRTRAALQRSESLASMGRMTAGIAHEIRNPLGIIRATATRLKKQYDDPDEPDERFDYIPEEVDRLNMVLTRYLSFARDEPPQLEPLQLVPIVQRTLKLMEPEIQDANVQLETHLPEGCWVRGDAQRLQQLLLNLVLNSMQAMPEGGTLTVSLRNAEAGVCLDLQDSGPGIPALDRERVFEPFFTTKEQGSGLGMTVVQRIAEQHHGEVQVGEGPSGGARVQVRLPRIERGDMATS